MMSEKQPKTDGKKSRHLNYRPEIIKQMACCAKVREEDLGL